MKILVTGGTGMVGNAIKRNITGHEMVFVGSLDYDLTRKKQVVRLFSKFRPEVVIHLAAKVGGVKDNSDYVYKYYYQNILINTNVIEQCSASYVRKLIALSSTCVYPKVVKEYPIKEEELHNGYPEETNFGYAFAKRMMQVQINAARIEHKHEKSQNHQHWSVVYPSNLYGPQDTFDLQRSHVIPALMLRFYQAKIEGKNEVEIYGTGCPLRQLTYVDDLAKFLINMIHKDVRGDFNFANPINYSIAQIAQSVAKTVGYNGAISYNGKLDGVFRKDVDITKVSKVFQLEPFTSLCDGLAITYKWFLDNIKIEKKV